VPAGEGSAELTVQRSRFLALAFPALDRPGADASLDHIRALHHRATHHCSALLLGHPREPGHLVLR
jgi:putative IMPACT (imprinted ancient) family translation regulator